VAEQWQHDRDDSKFGEKRDGADQRVARVAPMWSNGGPGMVGWLEDRAERRAQRWPLELVLRRVGSLVARMASRITNCLPHIRKFLGVTNHIFLKTCVLRSIFFGELQ
jgi:hypothetical protein